jgi:peptide/nickel transport system substrate-binding protein
VTELQTRISQLLAGDVDLVYDFSLREVPRLRADKSVAVAVVPPADQMFVVYLNMRKPPFNKVEMRQAMGWALDRQGFIKNFLAGLGRPDNSPFTPQHWAHDPKTENAYSYNPDTVAKLLEKAGYPKGRGLTFSFLVPSGYPEFKEISTLLQATFASIGYRPAIEEVDIAQWAARLNQSRDFFACVDYPPRGSTDPALTYSAGQLFPPNAANVCGLTPDAIPGYVDELRKGATTLERGLRKAAYAKVQELWLDYLPGPILCHRSTAHGLRPYVREFVPHPAFQQSFADVWLAK